MSRGRGRTLWLAGLAAALAMVVAAPGLPPQLLGPLSWPWLGVVVALLASSLRAAYRRLGWPGPVMALAALAGIGFVTGYDWPGSADPRVPCRRNWSWLPAYLPRASPTESLSFEYAGTRVKLCYGSPRVRGRRMIGAGPVPFGSLWRTGANEPTTIRTSGPILVAGIPVDGKASLYTIPGPETWELVVNGATAQWGLESEYQGDVRAAEIGRTILPSEVADEPVEALRFTAGPGPAPDVRYLTLAWERTVLRIPVTFPAR